MSLTRLVTVLLLMVAAACAAPPVDSDGFFPNSLEIAWTPGPESVGPDGTARTSLPPGTATYLAKSAPAASGTPDAGAESGQASEQGAPKGDLSAMAQNPIANSISVPIENTLFFHSGEDDETTWIMNVQPVIPVSISDDWNLINRPIIPVMYVPGVISGVSSISGEPEGSDSQFGLGDINYTGFFGPKAPGSIIWGAGPSITIPTATDDLLGSGKWSAGPSVVALIIQKPIVAGVLLRHVWSFAGQESRDSVNQSVIQPFLNYNLDGGWYLMTSPVVVANWYQKGGNVWTVPLGMGAGKLMKFGKQAVNMNLQVYYNVARPENASDWALRVNIQFLFPK